MSTPKSRTTGPIVEIKDGAPPQQQNPPPIPFSQMKVDQYVELEIENDAAYKTVQKRIWRYQKKHPDTKWSIRSVGSRLKQPYLIRVYRIAAPHNAEVRHGSS